MTELARFTWHRHVDRHVVLEHLGRLFAGTGLDVERAGKKSVRVVGVDDIGTVVDLLLQPGCSTLFHLPG